jgi:hypothetical protein
LIWQVPLLGAAFVDVKHGGGEFRVKAIAASLLQLIQDLDDVRSPWSPRDL